MKVLFILTALACLAARAAAQTGGPAPATAASLAGYATVTGGQTAAAPALFTNAVSVSLSAANADGTRGGLSTFYTLDGGGAQNYSAPFAVAGAGVHLLTFWSVDRAGDVEPTHPLSFQVYLPPAAIVTLTSSANPAPVNQPVTLTAAVTAPVGETGTPTGTVTFYDGGSVLGTAPLSAGAASLSASTLSIGAHALSASYSGDSVFGLAAGGPLTQTVTGMRIMPMGDGLTSGYSLKDPAVALHGGYRGPLYAQTAGQGWAVQYVGSRVNGLGIGACEGHEGYSTTLAASREPALVAQYQPDVILLMSGVDDLEQNATGAQTLTNMGLLLDALSAAKPGVLILTASLTPFTYPSMNPAQQAVFNAGLPALVTQKAAAGENVSFVDMHNLCGFVPSDFPPGDTVHPIESGYAKMATVWYNALAALPLAH